MSQLNVTPVPTATVGTDPAPKPVRPAAGSPTAAPTGGGTAPPRDTVTLSPASQVVGGSGAGGPELTDSQATDTAVTLRQQLGNQNLSVGARQNQSILSLLRG
jgi:hypothetical protein